MIRRIGTFFLLLGGFLIFLFVYTDWLHAAYFRFLIFGALSMAIGIGLFTTAPKPPPPPGSGRFRMLKREKKTNSK